MMSECRFVSVAESEEYSKISDMFRTKMRELVYLTKPIENMPYAQVCSTAYAKAHDTLCVLEFKTSLTSIGCCCDTRKYAFSKDLLKYLAKAMRAVTIHIQNELRKYFEPYEFKYHSKRVIERFISHFGYYDIELKDASRYLNGFYLKREVPKKRLPKKYNCDYCRDGGCVHCEPWRFI